MGNFQMFKLDLEKVQVPEIKLATCIGSSKSIENSRKTSTSAGLTTVKPTVWMTTNWKIFQETGTPHHLTCIQGNLYAGQEATVKTRHGTTDWIQIRKDYDKVVYCHHAYLTAAYIMGNAGLGEAQTGIKIAGRNINNLR